jgi:ankyrin repeat protein
VVQALLAAGADANVQEMGGATALILASDNGNLEIVQALIAAKADLNLRQQSGETALMLAWRKYYTEIVTALLNAGAERNGYEGDFKALPLNEAPPVAIVQP